MSFLTKNLEVMKKFTRILKFAFVLALTLNMSVELMAQAVTINPPALSTTTIVVGNTVNLTATRSGSFSGSGNYTYTWSATGPATVSFSGTNPQSTNSSSSTKTASGFTVAGDYTITCTVSRGTTSVTAPSKKVTVLAAAPTVPSIWATSSDGTEVSSFVVANGTYCSGPTNLVTPTFTGTGGGSSTAALGLSGAQGQGANGTFYYLPNNYSSNQGVVTIYGRDKTGAIAQVGTMDVNGSSDNTNLTFVRLGMGPDGSGWILAGDASSTVYLVKFVPTGTNGLGAATVTVEDASVGLVGGNATDFFNGDLCVSGNGTIYALANSSSGSVTRIYKGSPNGSNTTFTKIFDLVNENGATFTGSVNGVAFDLAGSIYISTATGLYYVDANTVNTGSGTVGCFWVATVSGLQDLASNVFPQQTTLPVIMSSFTVSKQGDNAMLNWKTATEINSDHFEIERSYDGINFTKIGVKSAAGNSASDISYQYTDAINYSYQIVYYRIKSVDADTKSSYSKIIPLRLNGGSIKDFTVFPNPFTSDIKLQVNSLSETTGVLRITNTLGQVVYNSNVSLQKGENILVVNEGLDKLNSGLMILELITPDSKVSQKIMKR